MPTIDAPSAERFEAERPRLVGLAYRIIGSRIDAEDVVQEAWLRFERSDPTTIDEPAAWLTTVVGRLALDHLRSARVRRESYVGPWLPELVRSDDPVALAHDPQVSAEIAESLTVGFLRLLDTLSPTERVVFLLSDVFDVPHAQIATVVERSPEATRQIASRARRRVRDARPDPTATESGRGGADQVLLTHLVAALAAGEVDELLRLLAPDAVLISDGGAAERAARRPVVGADRIARFLANLARRILATVEPDLVDIELTQLNNGAGAVVTVAGVAILAAVLETDGNHITTIHAMRNPDKLAALARTDPLR